MKKEYEIAQTSRRLGSLVIDYLLVFLIWYLLTVNNLNKVDELLKTLDPDMEGSLDIFVKEIFGLYVAFIFKWIVAQLLVFALIPAIIGNGKSIGKLVMGISVVYCETLEEISPSRLLLREFICRSLLESLLIIPLIVSFIMMLVRKDSKSVHDLISKTVVIKRSMFSTD